MAKKIIKMIKISLLQLVLFFSTFVFASAHPLQTPDDIIGDESLMSKFSKSAGFDSGSNNGTQLGETVAAVITAFLGLLGIIFIILILYAGYNWMTAAGDEQKVTKAKDTIQKAIIGLIIIVAAYAITAFVFKALPFGEGSDGSSMGSSGVGI